MSNGTVEIGKDALSGLAQDLLKVAVIIGFAKEQLSNPDTMPPDQVAALLEMVDAYIMDKSEWLRFAAE